MTSLLNNIFFIKTNQRPILERLRKYMHFGRINTISNTLLDASSNVMKQNKKEEADIEEIDMVMDNTISSQNEVINNTLTESNVDVVTYEPTVSSEPEPESQRKDFVSPKQQDTLFWCVYIAVHGYDEYMQISRNYGVKELEIKKKIADDIIASPYKMKHTNYKITKIMVQEILSELMTSQKSTSMLCLYSMAVHYNIRILIVDSTQKLLLEFLPDTSNTDVKTFVLYKDSYGKYKLDLEELSTDKVNELKTKMICLENFTKPFKAISNYKLNELEEIAKKVGVYDETKKYKKNELYEEITHKCNWQ
jgi:hypothetical protein|uniref:Uncharacterized protein n=1 Tax=viral metagenome TaxID=1070528 RepID=A0A6C0H2S2_9ZZZZ